MLDDLKFLEESLTGSQISELKSILGNELYTLLDSALDSETEEDAKVRVSEFVNAVKRKPMKIIKARRLLSPEQSEAVMRFLDP